MTDLDKRNTLIWIDLEMTGLVPETDRIIEIATLVTDSDLNTIAQGPVIAVKQSDEALAGMDEWNQRTHGNSGLIERVRNSLFNDGQAESATLEFLREYSAQGELEEYFHYRNLDVSTLKELAKRWSPQVLNSLTKRATHQAMDDIKDSIAELQHYREHFIR
jgi:oligoribonuclease